MAWSNCALHDRISRGTKFQETPVLDVSQNIYLIVVWVLLSLTYLILLNILWAPSKRRVHNDVIGWQISILGTIYAVTVGFMLYAVWANFQAAENNVNAEANALVNLFRSAQGLPAPQRSAIQIAAVNYGNAVVAEEWSEMDRDQTPIAGKPFVRQMWSVLSQTPAQSYLEQASLQRSMSELSELARHRRVRILDSESGMPALLWAVLVVGGIITIASCGLIGTENIKLHFVLIVAISLLISLALVAVADIDRAFQGGVHVNPTAFVRADATMLNP
jgi:Protein of unknown function (DUF4239)